MTGMPLANYCLRCGHALEERHAAGALRPVCPQCGRVHFFDPKVAVGVIVVIPIANVFAGALTEGIGTYWKNLIADPDTLHSIYLTLTVVPIALVANVVFGIASAWAISRFSFPGRTLLVACIGGTVEVVSKADGAWRSATLATLPAGAARLATDGERVVVACDDGALRLIEGASVTVLHQDPAKEKARGAVLADLEPSRPGLEAATAGYSGAVTVLRLGPERSSVTALEDAGRLHHLATLALEGPPRRLGLLACGYAGKVYLLTPSD